MHKSSYHRGFTFKPEHTWRQYIGIGGAVFMGLFLLLPWTLAITGGSTLPPTLTSAMMLVVGIGLFSIPARTIRTIEVRRSTIEVNRYLWPTENYSCDKIINVSTGGIIFEDGQIGLQMVKDESAEQLVEIMEEAVERGYLNEEQLNDDNILARLYIRRMVPFFGASAVGVSITGILWGLESTGAVASYAEGAVGPGGHPFFTVALIIAGLVYYPLSRMASNFEKEFL